MRYGIALLCVGTLLFFVFIAKYTFAPSVENKSDTADTPAAQENISVEPYTEHSLTSSSSDMSYPVHTNIVATVFWIGEPQGNGSSENNAMSAWDDEWMKHYGGYDDPVNRNGYHPKGFTPTENPFYLDLPYNDFYDEGNRKANAIEVVPWAHEKEWSKTESMMKNRWVRLSRNGITCYGQIEDAGPYEYDDHGYVFGNNRPKNTLANNAGLDVSPALRDCLKFDGINNASNRIDWQFVDANDVPNGPWKEIVTTSGVYWK